MKRFIPFIFLFFIISCTSPRSKEKVEPENSAISQDVYTPKLLGYKLVWEDDFNGATLDSTKWEIRQIGPRRIGYNDARSIKVANGNLNIMYDIVGDSILVGAVGSQGRFETTYGYFECKARMPKSVGPWAAFWLQSPLISAGEDPAKYGVEVDIFEYFKEYGADITTHAYHWAYGPNQRGVGPLKSQLKGLDDGFHLFALEWTPEKYVFYIDGLKFHEVKEAISHIDEYMILSYEPVDKLEGIKKACAPDTFMVDYVKVYKK
ncbi:MAG: glycoside hydrolase family 16 protein [Massilibacteroides sp.]|nr:glycoside hydrolase family 16 protein [Massilibacteroides sp.]MDD3061287.1 glycoside hydrolase family 16 protein [Massilibacteroides sp.]MDD4114876.1 glycoside hydrolase family 16 protein [Massilibacteroides sp.]MDD4659784.1 glycoside hydrolase family 16 protein [Massilibacteroides sp.]